MYPVSPKQNERFYLRLLLLHVKGVTSYEHLKTFNNIEYSSYYEVCKARNLIQTDEEWDKCLNEASQYKFPFNMCQLFSYICVFHNPINAGDLFKKYRSQFYPSSMDDVKGTQYALKIMNKILITLGFSTHDFNLPEIETCDIDYNSDADNMFQLNDNSIEKRISTLTDAQNIIFSTVINAINGKSKDKCIFIDGPGGSGKSYLLNTLISYFQINAIKFVPVAWTGIAANLLEDSKTVHTTFKLPLNINEQSTCNITANSNSGQEMKLVQVVIWDEITMTSKHAFEAVDRMFRDICDNNNIFGGKVVIVSGDFRQTLPIVKHGNRTQIIENCIKKCHIWNKFITMSLKDNKRVTDSDLNFKKWLLRVGDGKFDNTFEEQNEIIDIPKEMLSNGNIIGEIYGTYIDSNKHDYYDSIILAPKNTDVLEINNKILSFTNEPERVYVSHDSAEDANNEKLDTILPLEFLNSLTPNGLPQHKLKFKKASDFLLDLLMP